VIGKSEEEHWRETQKKISENQVKICTGVVGQSNKK
jgi:hypothetical protein